MLFGEPLLFALIHHRMPAGSTMPDSHMYVDIEKSTAGKDTCTHTQDLYGLRVWLRLCKQLVIFTKLQWNVLLFSSIITRSLNLTQWFSFSSDL